MKIDKKVPISSQTMSNFYTARNGMVKTDQGIPSIKTYQEDTTVNVRGKLKNLEREILEVSQVLNFHKKEVDLLKLEKDTLQQVLTK